jgi:hypothetical protein
METGSIVIVNLQNPKEKVFGKLAGISSSGITVRGMDVNSFNDWMNQFALNDKIVITPTTMFFPMHRVVSCYLDENMGEVPSLSSQFAERTEKKIEDLL